LEHLDLDVGITSPNEQHSTIQPMELTSPMGVAKIPHQPGAQNFGIGQANQKSGASSYIMASQRHSPINK